MQTQKETEIRTASYGWTEITNSCYYDALRPLRLRFFNGYILKMGIYNFIYPTVLFAWRWPCFLDVSSLRRIFSSCTTERLRRSALRHRYLLWYCMCRWPVHGGCLPRYHQQSSHNHLLRRSTRNGLISCISMNDDIRNCWSKRHSNLKPLLADWLYLFASEIHIIYDNYSNNRCRLTERHKCLSMLIAYTT